jgi:hypothetical protein
MTSWTLAQNGDALERQWAATVAARFPNYDRFWGRHVVPLTYRVSDPSNIYLRSAVCKELEALATTNYGVFGHLVGCHEQLGADRARFAARDIYNFYSRLYSVGEAAKRFLAAVRAVLREYNGVYIADDGRRFRAHGAPGLWARFNEAFETRTKDYRGQQVHDWGFPVIGQQIPRREHLSRWLGKGLGQLDAFLREPNAEQRVATEFVDALQQAAEDLDFVERVMNDVWDMALRELERLRDIDRYGAHQGAGADTPPPPRIQTTTFSSASSAVYYPARG